MVKLKNATELAWHLFLQHSLHFHNLLRLGGQADPEGIHEKETFLMSDVVHLKQFFPEFAGRQGGEKSYESRKVCVRGI